MPSIFGRWLIISLLISSHSFSKPLPVEAFSALPKVSSVEMSPNGQFIASIINIHKGELEGTLVNIYDIETKSQTSLAHTDNEKFVINWIEWANDQHLLISARFPATRYGIPTTETRLLIGDVEANEIKPAFSTSYLRRQNYVPQFQDQIVDLLLDDPDHILLEANFEGVDSSAVYRVNLKKQRVRRVIHDKSDVISWYTDRSGEIRIALTFDQDTTFKVLHRPVGEKKWQTLWEFEALSEDSVSIMGFDGDPNLLYVKAYKDGRKAILKVDLSDPKLTMTPVFTDDTYDISGSLRYSHTKKRVVGISNNITGRVTFFDEELRALQLGIDKALPDTTNLVVTFSEDESRYIVLSSSDTNSGSYLIGDRNNNSIDYFGFLYPELTPDLMSEKNWITYKARDGVEIEAALTLPKEKKENLPTIIFPHGGPISFDDDGFDYWTQYFANKGYAVLQMNFRGSYGYGFDFMQAGLGNWGQEMQRDVEDGTRWLIDEGIANPEKICMVGASYGGYAALMEAAHNSDLYQCAVSFAGVTDVARLVKQHRRYTNYDIAKKQIGSDFSELKRNSPLGLAEQIDIPVLLVHGTKDRSVRVDHSQKLFKKLKRLDKDVTYIEQKDGDHHLSNGKHRNEFFNEMDRFLTQYLGS